MTDNFVCEECIEDEALRRVVSKRAESERCSYCGKSPAAYLPEVLDAIRSAIASEYGRLEDNLDNDGQVPEHFDIEQLFSEEGFHLSNDTLMQDIVGSFGDQVFARNKEQVFLASLPFDAWTGFKHLVMHERRYTFGSVGSELSKELDRLLWSPRNLLSNIGDVINDWSLLVEVDQSLEMWRAQLHKTGDTLKVPDRFTSPPIKFARYANRMSPAGISMFYGSDQFETAAREIVDAGEVHDGESVSAIRFRPKQPFLILDLTKLPERHSFFDEYDADGRIGVRFLSSFARDVSRPIKKDGREHIEYVPTQVFTEYVRHEVKTDLDLPIKGIKYNSSRDGNGCYVIFADDLECLPPSSTLKSPNHQILESVPDSIRTVDL